MRAPGFLLAVALVTLTAVSPVGAHEARSQREALTYPVEQTDAGQATADLARSTPPESPRSGRGMALAAVGIAGAALLARRRRSLALALAVGAVVLAFESGLHSVHHLDSPSDAARCAVAATATHSPGLLGDVTAALTAPSVWTTTRLETSDARPVPGPHRAFQSRAPPVSSTTRV